MALNQRLFTDALRDMQRAMAVFDHSFFNGIFNDHANSGFGRFPTTDIEDKDNSYELHAEIPGYDKKDIKIEVPDQHTLILSGSTKIERHEEPKAESKEKQASTDQEHQEIAKKNQDNQISQYSNTKYWVNERVSSSFSRSFNFPSPINAEKVKASYENGVLKLTIPKVAESQSRFIKVD